MHEVPASILLCTCFYTLSNQLHMGGRGNYTAVSEITLASSQCDREENTGAYLQQRLQHQAVSFSDTLLLLCI